MFAEHRLLGAARRSIGLYTILTSRGFIAVSNFYADLAIFGGEARRGHWWNSDATLHRTLAQVPVLSGIVLVPCSTSADEWRLVMLHAIYLAVGFGFLAVAVFYVVACDRI